MTYDNYIFDLYGTLIDIHTDEDSRDLWDNVAAYIKREFGVSYRPLALKKRYREVYDEEVAKLKKALNKDHPEIRVSWVWDRILAEGQISAGKNAAGLNIPAPLPNDGPVDMPSPEIGRLCGFFRETSRDRMKPYPGTEETLQKLKASGKKVFLLSNAQRSFTFREIEACGLLQYFDDVFISSDKMIMKPQKEFLEELIDKHALQRSKCVMIGNEISSDIGVAVNCGLSSILLNTFGYDADKIAGEIRKLGLSDKGLYPEIIPDGDIRKII